MMSLWTELKRRSAPLAWSGALMVLMLVVAGVASLFDDRVVTGLNTWFKPMKFAASIAIYLFTLAWFLEYLKPFHSRSVSAIARTAAIVMTLEYVLIFVQGARAVTSHFNEASLGDGLVFAAMGILISINTLLVVWTAILFFKCRPDIPGAYLWGIRIGLLLFLVFGLEGWVMIQHKSHTIGAPDGGPGLPFLGWSVEAGDLRYAHFIGMHALQALPLLGWFMEGRRERLPVSPVTLVICFAAFYLALAAWVFLVALEGQPIL
ncbi:MAG: hypothetical protein HKN29_05845 [Rhodothermales bacterium]|nr:hypothetical protein [Rhodothermales bacterium]